MTPGVSDNFLDRQLISGGRKMKLRNLSVKSKLLSHRSGICAPYSVKHLQLERAKAGIVEGAGA